MVIIRLKPYLFALILIVHVIHIIPYQNSNSRKLSFNYSFYNNLKKQVLSKYKRSFTLLDIGSDTGFYSFKVAREHSKASVVMIESGQRRKIAYTICSKAHPKNLILLNKKLSLEEFRILSEAEHFDVVLAFDLFTLYPKQCENALSHVLDLGENLILKVPLTSKIHSKKFLDKIHYYIRQSCKSIKILHQDSSSIIYWLYKTKKSLKRSHWVRPAHHGDRVIGYEIQSNYSKKKIIKYYEKNMTFSFGWNPGINLFTFKMLNGIYPTIRIISRKLYSLVGMRHTDFKIPNLIIQGHNIVPIDINDYRLRTRDPRRYLVTREKIKRIVRQLNTPVQSLLNNLSAERLC